MKNIAILVFASWLLSSCATLTKSQIEAVNQFAQTSQNFSSYPSKIFTELHTVREERRGYFANSINDPVRHVKELDDIYSASQSDLSLTGQTDITFKIIDKYAQALHLLSSDKFATDLNKQAKTFGIGLDSLTTIYNALPGVSEKIPAGIGGAVSQLITLGGKQYIRTKQAKEIKRFVPQADTLIAIMCRNLSNHLTRTDIQDFITNEEQMIAQDYTNFLGERRRLSATSTIADEQTYLQWKTRLKHIKALQKQTQKATNDLRVAHRRLLTVIQKRMTLTESVKELQSLHEQVSELNQTIKKISPSKS